MSAAHAVLPPSGAAAWVVCAGWVLMNQMFPESVKYKHDSDEGTATHWAASELLFGRMIDVGLVAPNGIVLTDQMVDGAELYVAAIDQQLARYGLTRHALHIEERIAIPGIHEHNWGTPDCWFYAPAAGVLVVFDFKFGYRYVDAFENWQLIDYTAGILDALGINGLADQALRVELVVVQPRSYHRDGPVRMWAPIASELRGYFNRLRHAAELALRPGAKCVPNPECLHCKGRHACRAIQIDAYRSAEISTDSLPLEMSGAAVGLELYYLRAAMQRLEGRITGLEEQAAALLRQGQVVPFSLMEYVQGREKWAVPANEVIALGKLFEKDLSKHDVITPNQAIKKGLPAEVVSQYTTRDGGLKLVPDNGANAKKVFG